MLGGKSVVMVLLLGLVSVPLSLFYMSSWGFLATLLGLLVRCLLVLFPFGIVLLALLAGPPLGGCRFLVAASVGAVREVLVDGAGQEVHWVGGSGPGGKRIRPNRKKNRAPRWFGDSVSSTDVEEIVSSEAFATFYP